MKIAPLNIKWYGNVCQWGHFRASGPKGVDLDFPLSLSLISNINKILGDFINQGAFSKEVNIIYIKWVYSDIGT
jgi:hypothetical protein